MHIDKVVKGVVDFEKYVVEVHGHRDRGYVRNARNR
jgi:hypothetical protein